MTKAICLVAILGHLKSGQTMTEQEVRNKAIELAIKTMPSLKERAKKFSTCMDKQVGVRLYSFDINGSFHRLASGFNERTSSCEYSCISPCLATHAEIRALINMVQKNQLINMAQTANLSLILPHLCISTLEPCHECVKALVYAGTKIIIFDQETNPAKSGVHVWMEHNPYGRGRWINLNHEYEVANVDSHSE